MVCTSTEMGWMVTAVVVMKFPKKDIFAFCSCYTPGMTPIVEIKL